MSKETEASKHRQRVPYIWKLSPEAERRWGKVFREKEAKHLEAIYSKTTPTEAEPKPKPTKP